MRPIPTEYESLLEIPSNPKSLTAEETAEVKSWCLLQPRHDIFAAFFDSRTPKPVRAVLLDCAWERVTGGEGDPPTPEAYLRGVR